MTRVFSIRSGGTSGLRLGSQRHRFLLVLLLLGSAPGYAGRAYAVPSYEARPAAAEKQRTEPKQADSVRTIFSETLLFSSGNGDWIERSEYAAVGRFLRAAHAHPETGILLIGWADTTGAAAFNRRLSAKRAAAVGRYLVRKGIAAERIRTEGSGEDASLPPDRARRVEMTAFVANAPSAIGNATAVTPAGNIEATAAPAGSTGTPDASAPAGCVKFPPPPQNAEQSAADGVTTPQSEPTEPTAAPESGGAPDATIPAAQSSIVHTPDPPAVRSEQQTAENMQPKTAQAGQPAEQQYERPGLQPKQETAENMQPNTVQAGQPAEQPCERPQPEQTAGCIATDASAYSGREPIPADNALSDQRNPDGGRYLGIKTNLAAWAGTIMNVAADVQVGRHWSVELPVLWCPWFVSDQHAIKTFTIQPEARYWLSKPGAGHFFGVHAHVGWFNVKWNRDRYQDTDRPLLGAGISYGYLLPLGEHWAGEFTLGAGYANMRYDTFYNMDNGARIDTRTKNYWGITRVGISVVYRFNLKK